MGPYSPMAAIEYAWGKFTANIGPFLGMGAIITVLSVGIPFIFGMASGGVEVFNPDPMDPDGVSDAGQLGSSLLQLSGQLIGGAIQWILGIALLRGALDVVDTGRVEFGAMFSRVPWGQALLAAILVFLASLLGLLVFCIGLIVVLFFLYYTNAAVLDGKSATEAVSASFTFVKENFADTFLYALIAIVVIFVITCFTCGIGGILTTPLFAISTAYTWRVLQGRPVVH